MALDVFPIECTKCDAKFGITRADLRTGTELLCPVCKHVGKTLDADTVEGLRSTWGELDAADDVTRSA